MTTNIAIFAGHTVDSFAALVAPEAVALANAKPSKEGDEWAPLFDNLGRFGVELETAGLSGVEASTVVYESLKALGVQCSLRTGYTCEVVLADGRAWSFVFDSSISTRNGKAVEVVSPILTAADFNMLIVVAHVLTINCAVANESCGMHVHVDGAPFLADATRTKKLIGLVRNFDGVIRSRTSDSRDHWCKPIDAAKVEKLLACKDMDQMKSAWYDGNTSRSSEHYDSSRYVGLNLHALWYKGTVEFRYFNGTLNPSQVVANALLCLHTAARSKRITSPRATNAERFFHLIRFTGKQFASARKLVAA